MDEIRKSRLTSGMFSSTTDLWATPQDFFDKLNEEFHFTLDPCATPDNAKCRKFYTSEQNGLAQDWQGETVFCNPPYGKAIAAWVKKCHDEAQKPDTTIVMLIPARTDTSYFHDYIYHKAELRFIRGRLKFGNSQNSAPFPSMVVVFKGYISQIKYLVCFLTLFYIINKILIVRKRNFDLLCNILKPITSHSTETMSLIMNIINEVHDNTSNDCHNLRYFQAFKKFAYLNCLFYHKLLINIYFLVLHHSNF